MSAPLVFIIRRLPRPTRRQLLVCVPALTLLGGGMAFAGQRYRIGIDPQTVRCLPDVRAVAIDLTASPPKRGGLVAFAAQGLEPAFEDGTLLVKILAGLPGDQVAVTEQAVTVNGKTFAHGLALAASLGHQPADYVRSYTVPDAHFIALGDGPQSLDSRYYGPVPLAQVRGRAWKLF